jgi:hypothetical protein
LRAGSRKWPPKYETLNTAKTEKKINKATGRLAQHYRCNACQEEYTSKDVQVDHIEPVIDPKKGFISWDAFIEALYCESDNLQVLCKVCHKEKTKEERQLKSTRQSKPKKVK